MFKNILQDNFSKKAFSLIEMMVVTVMASMIFVTVINLYFSMMKTKVDVEARQTLIQWSYGVLEKLNVLMADYTIDYEEYFNRKVVGCNDTYKWNSFEWTGNNLVDSWYCNNFTSYGNENSIQDTSSNHDYHLLYYCSSETETTDHSNEQPSNSSSTSCYDNSSWTWQNYVQVWVKWNTDSWTGCWDNGLVDYHSEIFGNWKQSYWQYALQYWDMWTDTDWQNWCVNDSDDTDMGKWPDAIADNTWVQELYLISKDGTERLFMRRALEEKEGSWIDNYDDIDDSDNIAKRYNIQMLKLKWFDAGQEHDFDESNSRGLFDGDIDTWACDYWEWFECEYEPSGNGEGIWWVYNAYKLPNDKEDGWVGIFGNDITISDWNMQIYPTQNPDYAWRDNDFSLNPYINIQIQTHLYAKNWINKINPSILSGYSMNLETTFNTRWNY